MAANDLDDAFVEQFESEVMLAYQRMGAKMLNTVRRKTNVVGTQTTFQAVGKMDVGTKARNGQVPISNPVHTPTACTLQDYYSANYIDKLDELKIQHDERSAITGSIAAALGRQSDQLIIDAITASATLNTATDTGALTVAKLQEGYEELGENDVPMDDGELYWAISPAGWVDLLGDAEFASADYVGNENLPLPGAMTAKVFMGVKVYQHSGLDVPSGTIRSCPLYHRSAIGHASGQDVSLDITWQGKEQAWLAVGSMSQGACLIDDDGSAVYNGVFLVQFTE